MPGLPINGEPRNEFSDNKYITNASYYPTTLPASEVVVDVEAVVVGAVVGAAVVVVGVVGGDSLYLHKKCSFCGMVMTPVPNTPLCAIHLPRCRGLMLGLGPCSTAYLLV